MEIDERAGSIHLTVKDSKVLTYLNMRNKPLYVNTDEENELMRLWRDKYYIAKQEYENSRSNSKRISNWRKAYLGEFYSLNEDGSVSEDRLKPIRKLAYELVEDNINSRIPSPKMSPRYHSDILPVDVTERLIKHNIDKMASEETNDRAEHHVLIDSFTWFKVGWNPFDNTHERSGNPIVTVCPIDTVFPQPGVLDYRDMEYIFEVSNITLSEAIEVFNRELKSPTNNDLLEVVSVYFLNEEGYVGKFAWCEETNQVLCNDLEWGIRKVRQCDKCGQTVSIEDECPVCGSKHIVYKPMKEMILDTDLKMITNPYRDGDSNDPEDDNNVIDEMNSIPKGTVIPHYLIRQLPFVPYRRACIPDSLYGISQVELVMEDQDLINKMLLKAERKTNESTTYVTKFKNTFIDNDTDREIKYIETDSPEEAQGIQVKQIMSDIQQEVTQAQVLYDIAKSTVGITDTDQGKQDTTARSGKAKQLQLQASAGRKVGGQTLRNLAWSGVYELIFKNLLAYCDEDRSFVKLLPDGTKREEVWSKYMFLAKDSNGKFYYRDDYAWSVDTATDITEDRAAMWQLIDNDFLNGTMGTEIDPARALKMYWQMKEQQGYPLAKYALEFLDEAQTHLPTDIEQILAQHPEAVQMALSFVKDQQDAMGIGSEGRGGARAGAGKPSDNSTKYANDAQNNNKTRAAQGQQTNNTAASSGGMQGGTQNVNI